MLIKNTVSKRTSSLHQTDTRIQYTFRLQEAIIRWDNTRKIDYMLTVLLITTYCSIYHYSIEINTKNAMQQTLKSGNSEKY